MSSVAHHRQQALPGAEGNPWIRSRRFDLLFLTASGALVFFPYLSYGLLKRIGASQDTASLLVGLAVTLLVGGPHMYSTYLRTALEPRFRQRFGILTYLPLVIIPALVILGSMYAFLVLLTGFFFWASIHVTHQAQYISETYRRKAGQLNPLDRWLDGAVILGALYTVAMYKFVEDRFTLGSSTLLFPDFLKHLWVARAFTVGFAILFVFYVVRTAGEIRRGESSWPRLVFMAATVALAFVIPVFDNLDIAFQGFNTWHSLQYLALTWFILTQKAERGEIGSDFVQGLAGTAQARLLDREFVAGLRHFPGQLGGALFAFGEQAGESLLMCFGLCRFRLGARQLFVARLQRSGDRTGFAPRRGKLGFKRAGVGGAGAGRNRQHRYEQATEQRGCTERCEVLSELNRPQQKPEATDSVSDCSQVVDNPQRKLRSQARRSALGDVAARQVGADPDRDRADTDPDTDLTPVAAAQVPEGEADRGPAERVVHQPSPSSRSRIRCAIRDCNDQSSMKPGEAACEKRPPD